MRVSFSVPSLAAGLAAVNASTAVYDAASVIRRRSGGLKKIRQSIKPSTGCVGERATIQKISMNPAMAAMEISKIRKENRRLHCELARMVIQEAMEKDGQFCWMVQRATRSGGPWESWTAPSPRHCSRVRHRRR